MSRRVKVCAAYRPCGKGADPNQRFSHLPSGTRPSRKTYTSDHYCINFGLTPKILRTAWQAVPFKT